MAKKFGKFLLFTAAVGAVAAGTYYYLQNKNEKPLEEDDDFDDFDDFDEDLDDEDTAERSYFSLDLENAPEDNASAASMQNTAETVEEFFNDEDEEESSES